jgi:hypothetical protein
VANVGKFDMMIAKNGLIDLGSDDELLAAWDAIAQAQPSGHTGIVDGPDWAIEILGGRILQAESLRSRGSMRDDQCSRRNIGYFLESADHR